jgi:L-lactate dehydrogenase complex protein LldE
MQHPIQLFITCLVDTLYPQVGEAVVEVFKRLGVKVECPAGQTCCGQPAFNSGLRPAAREMAIHTIRVFGNAPGPVVVPSGSCAAMIRRGYLELFADDKAWIDRARELAERTYEFSEYLVDVLDVEDVGAQFAGPVTYHSSCHLLRELNIDRQPRALLANVRDSRYEDGRPLELTPLPYGTECCGFGGIFSAEHPLLSSAILERKLKALETSAAPTLVACDAGCLAHISGGLHRRGWKQQALHLAQILASC